MEIIKRQTWATCGCLVAGQSPVAAGFLSLRFIGCTPALSVTTAPSLPLLVITLRRIRARCDTHCRQEAQWPALAVTRSTVALCPGRVRAVCCRNSVVLTTNFWSFYAKNARMLRLLRIANLHMRCSDVFAIKRRHEVYVAWTSTELKCGKSKIFIPRLFVDCALHNFTRNR